MIGYVEKVDFEEYAAARGITLEADPEVLLTRALDYIEAMEYRFKGLRTGGAQPLAWPRRMVFVYGSELPSDVVPQQIMTAQMQLAIHADKQDLMPAIGVGASGSVTGRSVGDVSVSYGEGSRNQAPLFPDVMRQIAQLLAGAGGSNFAVSRL